jgi:hypothetical protein
MLREVTVVGSFCVKLFIITWVAPWSAMRMWVQTPQESTRTDFGVVILNSEAATIHAPVLESNTE